MRPEETTALLIARRTLGSITKSILDGFTLIEIGETHG